MEIIWYTSLLIIFSIFLIQKLFQKQKENLPPSPPALPILGHLHLIKAPYHRALHHLAAKHGPIFHLRLGTRSVVVVSSPSIAQECFTKNDIALANRPKTLALEHFSYNDHVMTSSPYGDHWRNLRRVITLEVLSSAALNRLTTIREEETRFMVRKLVSSCNENNKVDLSSLFLELGFNVVMKILAGQQWSESLYLFGANLPIHICDCIPFLRWIGYGGFEKMVLKFQKESDEFLKDLVEESRRKYKAGSCLAKEDKTMIQALLSLQEAEPEYYTDDVIKAVLLDIFAAGPETSSQTVQWAMALLLNHPEVMEKARSEIDHHVPSGRLIEDSDLSKLPYLHCIINETLRLFSTAPLLLPHESSEDCTISGYNVPRGTALVVNAWAIHRDPNLWEEATKFKPERFEGVKKEHEGYKFLPFGMGRRACPGSGMAMRFVGLALATFIQCFEWERIGPELVDLQEGSGFSLPKVQPLVALYRPRPSMSNLISRI